MQYLRIHEARHNVIDATSFIINQIFNERYFTNKSMESHR